MYGFPIFVDDRDHEIHGQAITMRLVRFELSARFVSSFCILEYLARRLPFESAICIYNHITYPAMYIGPTDQIGHTAVGKEIRTGTWQLYTILKSTIAGGSVAYAVCC